MQDKGKTNKNSGQPVQVKCIDCGVEFMISYSGYCARKRTDGDNPKFRCSECNRKYRSEKKRREMAEMDPEKKKAMYKKVSKGRKEFLAGLSPEEKDAMMNNINQGRTQWLENISPEEKERISKAHSESNKRRWENTSNYDRYRISEEAKERWRNKPQEEKDAHAQHSKDMWVNRSEEKNNEIKEKFSEAKKEFWNGISTYKRNELSEKISNTLKEKWKEKPIDEVLEISENHKSYYNNLSDEEKELRKKSRNISSINTTVTRLFEKYISYSYILKDFDIIKECKTSNNGVTHRWDYGFYDKDGTLNILVDIDGDNIHAYKIDYDGNFFKEEYDEKRSLSVPSNVKHLIITENKMKESVALLEKYIVMSFNDYMFDKVKHFEYMPFPYVSYDHSSLILSYKKLESITFNDLQINNRNGDMLINQFHNSIYNDKCINSFSPYEIWNNKNLLTKYVLNNYISQIWLNPNKILQGFNRSKVSVFSAGRAKMIILKYLSEFETIFDPFSGYSGRMLGTISLGKRYIGQDISERHVAESNNMMEFLRKYEIKFDSTIIQKDILQSSGKYECLFTCPPYADEEYEDVPFDARSCDDWIDECLKRFDCKRYVFVVNTTQRYQDYVVETLNNKSIFGVQKEYIIIINANRES